MDLRRFITCMRAIAVILIATCGAISGPANTAFGQELFGSATGLPLPRFVSLASSRINVRSGPGKEYPIRWVYTRADLPVQVTDEAGDWRKIKDFDAENGWIHTSLLKGDRTIMVVEDIRELYRTPSPQAIVTARLEPGVIGALINCETAFCYVDFDGRRGWLERSHFWGVLEGEIP